MAPLSGTQQLRRTEEQHHSETHHVGWPWVRSCCHREQGGNKGRNREKTGGKQGGNSGGRRGKDSGGERGGRRGKGTQKGEGEEGTEGEGENREGTDGGEGEEEAENRGGEKREGGERRREGEKEKEGGESHDVRLRGCTHAHCTGFGASAVYCSSLVSCPLCVRGAAESHGSGKHSQGRDPRSRTHRTVSRPPGALVQRRSRALRVGPSRIPWIASAVVCQAKHARPLPSRRCAELESQSFETSLGTCELGWRCKWSHPPQSNKWSLCLPSA